MQSSLRIAVIACVVAFGTTAELGDRFDLRRFHNALIGNGAVPLDVLDHLIYEWIAAERKRAAVR